MVDCFLEMKPLLCLSHIGKHQQKNEKSTGLILPFCICLKKKGKFKEVKYWSSKDKAGTFDTSDKLEELVQSLGTVEYCDIEVEPFETEIEGIKFGLIPNEEADSIDLQHSSTISFQEPWDGEYYT